MLWVFHAGLVWIRKLQYHAGLCRKMVLNALSDKPVTFVIVDFGNDRCLIGAIFHRKEFKLCPCIIVTQYWFCHFNHIRIICMDWWLVVISIIPVKKITFHGSKPIEVILVLNTSRPCDTYVRQWTVFNGSCNGFSQVRCQAFAWTNVDLLSIRPPLHYKFETK